MLYIRNLRSVQLGLFWLSLSELTHRSYTLTDEGRLTFSGLFSSDHLSGHFLCGCHFIIILQNCSEKIISEFLRSKARSLLLSFCLQTLWASFHVIESNLFVTLRLCLSPVTVKRGGWYCTDGDVLPLKTTYISL